MSSEITLNNDSTAFTRYHDASPYEYVVVKCTGLGAAESVAVNIQTLGSWIPVGSFDAAGATNNIVLFTGSGGTPANVRQMKLDGDHYQFVASGDPAGTVILTARNGPKKA